MADKTHIEWTDATWNVVTGCTRISEGCRNCYIQTTPPFRIAHRRFNGTEIGSTTGVRLHEDRMFTPFSWRKPRRIFVCSLADMFHDEVPDLHIAKTFATMARTPRHTYQVLTKRPARLRSLLAASDFCSLVERIIGAPVQWPLPNVWGGVSVEDQKWAAARIPILMDTPLAVRWISAEPLLGPVRLPVFCACGCMKVLATAQREVRSNPGFMNADQAEADVPRTLGLDWVVVGGESGPGARPMDPEWARSLRDQCNAANVPFLFKQWGAYCPPSQMPEDTFQRWDSQHGTEARNRELPWKVGKTAAGRLLDDRLHDGYPAVRS